MNRRSSTPTSHAQPENDEKCRMNAMENTLINDDCGNAMKTLPEDSIDLIASDPPYQLSCMKTFGARQDNADYADSDKAETYGNKANPFCGKTVRGFMGKEWDVLPTADTLKECLRVLKPGAFAFWLMTPRQDSLCEFIGRLRQAGFVTSFTSLYWIYSTGFPKAANTSKLIEKKLGEEVVVGKAFNVAGKGYRGLVDKPRDFEKHEPSSNETKGMQGSFCGYQPKPAVEVIVVSMKPLSKKTYVEQALDNGKGVTWLDDARIPFKSEDDFEKRKRGLCSAESMGMANMGEVGFKPYNSDEYVTEKGRFPANILVSDDVLDDGSIHKGRRALMGSGVENVKPANVYGKYGDLQSERGYDDEGTISRYFSLDAWWSERIRKLPKEAQDTFPCLIVPKPAPSEKNVAGNMTIDNSDKYDGKMPCSKADKGMANHPTVKPLALMSYLITLGSREGDAVLDPFMGSGTTCAAAYLLSRKFVGIERDSSYFAIAKERVGHYTAQKKLGDF